VDKQWYYKIKNLKLILLKTIAMESLKLEIEYLEWDSRFFNLNVGRILLNNINLYNNFEEVLSQINDYDLIYIFSLTQIPVISQVNLKLVDVKRTYKLDLANFKLDKISNDFTNNINVYDKTFVIPELEELAYKTGEYSRFKTDSYFDTSSFKRLYKTWIENSVKKINCDEIYVYSLNDRIVGFVTVKFDKNSCRIGLIGVDENYRGMQVGGNLIKKVINEASFRNITSIYVDTQKDNQIACRFYEKYGFKIHLEQYIYHYWRIYDKL